jgi:Transposase IS200 like
MARSLRIEYPGAFYHVMARGNRREAIFLDDDDRRTFVKTLGEASERCGWRVHAWVLMGNHYHLLLETSEVIEVRVPYDQKADDDGSGSLALAVALELANSLTGTENRRTIRFAFVPDGAVDGSVSAAYQAIYDDRQVRLLAGFELFESGEFDPARFRSADGKIQ